MTSLSGKVLQDTDVDLYEWVFHGLCSTGIQMVIYIDLEHAGS